MQFEAAKSYIIERLTLELSPLLTYHCVEHTLDVFDVVSKMCEEKYFTPHACLLMKTAALYHDIGFIEIRQGHELRGCDMVRQILPNFDYSRHEIEQICGMIVATRIPQNPKNEMERLICDADLDYLGRNDFDKIGQTLFTELKNFGVVSTEKAWNELQVSFLSSHSYHTLDSIETREPVKQKHLKKLKTWLSANS